MKTESKIKSYKSNIKWLLDHHMPIHKDVLKYYQNGCKHINNSKIKEQEEEHAIDCWC